LQKLKLINYIFNFYLLSNVTTCNLSIQLRLGTETRIGCCCYGKTVKSINTLLDNYLSITGKYTYTCIAEKYDAISL